jgi:hypothetical protein
MANMYNTLNMSNMTHMLNMQNMNSLLAYKCPFTIIYLVYTWYIPEICTESIWNLQVATPKSALISTFIDVDIDIEDYNLEVFFNIKYSNLDIDVTVFNIAVTKKNVTVDIDETSILTSGT